MKAFAASLLALAAGAKAEADPQLLLGSHLTYGAYPYAHHVAAPLAYVRPISYANDAVKSEDYAAKGEYVAANAGAVHIAKREAEAEPWLSYAGVAYPGVPVTGTVYGAYPGAYRRFAIGKREAEAEADPALLYGAGVYGAGVYGAYPYAHHAAYPYGLVRPISYANDAVKPEDYASKGQYVAVAPGAVHVAKREAEAEPWLTYAHAPLAYGYGVAPYAAYGHVAAVHPVGSYSNDAVKATPAYAGKGQYVAVSAGAVHVA